MISTHLIALVLDWRTWLAMTILMVGPPFVLRAMAHVYHRDDPRRAEMIAELHAVPFLRRPLWVLEQVEFVVWEGIPDRWYMLAAGRVIERWRLGDGVKQHRMHPATFDIPSEEERRTLEAGDVAKLMFTVSGTDWGERMWVKIERRTRRGYVGRLSNTPFGVPRLDYGDKIRFRQHHIIDFNYADDPIETAQPADENVIFLCPECELPRLFTQRDAITGTSSPALSDLEPEHESTQSADEE
jgi:hypothetical protein